MYSLAKITLFYVGVRGNPRDSRTIQHLPFGNSKRGRRALNPQGKNTLRTKRHQQVMDGEFME